LILVGRSILLFGDHQQIERNEFISR
jgi:hypothetical protein